MNWIKDRDLLIAQTRAFVQSVTGKTATAEAREVLREVLIESTAVDEIAEVGRPVETGRIETMQIENMQIENVQIARPSPVRPSDVREEIRTLIRSRQLDQQIEDTQARIEVEKDQVAAMSRAIYREPPSFWMLIARTGSLSEALRATSDMVVAGQRAHALQARLEADLQKLQADREARQAELDRESGARDQLVASLSTLNYLLDRQTDITDQMADVVARIQGAENGLTNQPPDVTAALAALLESQVQALIQQSNQAAWNQARVGVGLALVTHMLPTGTTIAGLTLSWPMAGARVTQPFGPSTLLLEPPLGPYKHFHTGIDLAAPFGTTVNAAAAGVVVAVGHSSIGYGNYVVIGHGGGIMTLYGHLLETDVTVGNVIARGQRVGLEGSSGWSTGPHVHFELRVNDAVVDPMPYLPKLPG